MEAAVSTQKVGPAANRIALAGETCHVRSPGTKEVLGLWQPGP